MDSTRIIKSAIFGVAVGDALGVPVEFTTRAERKADPVTGMRRYGTHSQPAGTWSDDTSMTLATMDSIAACESINYGDIMEKFLLWRQYGEYTPHWNVFDVGITCDRAIASYRPGVDPTKCGGVGERDNGNGSLMRIMPASLYVSLVPFVWTGSLEKAVEIISNVSSLTHGHLQSKLGCILYTSICREIIRGKKMSRMKSPLEDTLTAAWMTVKCFCDNNSDPDYTRELKNYGFLSSTDKIRLTPEADVKSSGYVVDTLKAAVWCLLTTTSFRECVLKAVNLGDDTDTVGAVTGGLAGLWYGFENIPNEWLRALPRREWIEEICEGFGTIKAFKEAKLENSGTLKSIVEAKLGITIEEHMKRIADELEYCNKHNVVIDHDSGLENLSIEESEFMRLYCISNGITLGSKGKP